MRTSKKVENIEKKEKKSRGRPRKHVKETVEVKPKLTLAEKQAIKLQLQRQKEINKEEPKNKDRFYCSNKELYAELVKWRDSNLEEEQKQLAAGKKIDYTSRKISEDLGLMFMKIGNKLLNHSSFRNYRQDLKDDMLMFGIEKLIKGLKNFNFEFNNAFAYCTQAFWNAYLTMIGKHYKHINLRKDVMLKLSMELQAFSGINPNSSIYKCIKTYIENDSAYNAEEH